MMRIMKRFTRYLIMTGLCTVLGFTALAFGHTGKTEAATPETLELLEFGKELLGTPYQFGGSSDGSAFDCSSFIQFVFKESGITLPRTSTEQATVGEKVEKGDLSIGDLVFFKTNGKSISHVAIYAGNNKILHSSSSKGVAISDMSSSYWSKNYVTARRVL